MISGTIKSVKLTDFMAFKSLTFNPQSNLNFIIGSNGTGKSSLICAIVLGLGGRPKIVKRAEKLKDFIKDECGMAVIELTLSNTEGSDYEIKRIIGKDCTSRWYLNNNVVDKDIIEQLVKKLNIQLDNLCQILPQDRVADFAKMRQVELLINTQKAIGDVEMCERHNFLKTQSCAVAKQTNEFNNLQSTYDQESKRNETYKQRSVLYLKKMKMEKIIKNIKLKMQYLRFKSLKEDIKGMDKTIKEKEQERKTYLFSNKTILQTLENCSSSLVEEYKAFQISQKTLTAAQKKVEDIQVSMGQIVERIAIVQQECEQNKQLKLVKQSKLEQSLKLQDNQIKLYEKENKKVAPIEEMIKKNTQSIEKICAKGRHLKTQRSAHQSSINLIGEKIKSLENRLNALQSRAQIKLDHLKKLDRDTYEAVLWLRDNKSKFSGTVYEPLVLVIEPKDEKFSKYIEAVVNVNDFYSFICENESDCILLIQELRDKMKLIINCVMAPPKPSSFYRSRVTTTEIRTYQFYSYISETFDAPDKVKAYLFSTYFLHDIPIGGKGASNKRTMDIMFSNGFKKLLIENFVHNMKLSKYGDREKVISSSKIRESKFLNSPCIPSKNDIEKVEMEWKELKAQQALRKPLIDSLDQKVIENKEESEKFFNENLSLKEEVKRINSLRFLCEQHKHHVANAIEEDKAVKPSIEASEKQLAKSFEEALQLSFKFKLANSHYSKHSLIQLKKQCFVTALEKKEENLNKQVDEVKTRINAIESTLESFKNNMAKAKEESTMMLKKFENEAGVKIKDEKLPKDLAKVFSTLPDIFDELDQLKFREEAKISCLPETDPQDVNDLEENETFLANISKDLDERKKTIDDLKLQIEKTKELWLPSVNKLVEKIDKNFNHFMKILNFAGEVSLNKGSNPDDFTNYGISIRVKFRNREPLMELTSTYQSGGERSVSTIIYMMSMQELTQVPFRCLDEINQGMDSTNERRVYELVSKISSSSNCSQYFLITPKLLPGLKLGPSTAITVLNQILCEKLNNNSRKKR